MLCMAINYWVAAIRGQIAKKSWWPLHSTWMGGTAGANAGWWTPDNEAWFQKRLEAIRDGIEQPLTASQWTKALRGQKMAQRLRHKMEAAAGDVLQKVGVAAN